MEHGLVSEKRSALLRVECWVWCLTFKGRVLGNMERGMLPSHGVLGVGAARREHLMEGGYTVAGLELEDVLADLVDDARDVVAFVRRRVPPLRELPVLGVGAAHHDLDDDLVGPRLGDWRVDNLDLWSCGGISLDSQMGSIIINVNY